jgi:hypothetical protein
MCCRFETESVQKCLTAGACSNLFSNRLTGTIMPQFGNMVLERLYVATSAFCLLIVTCRVLFDNKLSGTIPRQLGFADRSRMLALYVFSAFNKCPLSVFVSRMLHSNALSGTVPTEFAQLSALVEFTVDNNSLSGSLPRIVGANRWTTWYDFVWRFFVRTLTQAWGQSIPSGR